jgi:YD repeat-containing protein
MATSIGGKNVATTGSDHMAPGPAPATSLAPPTPPAGPVPAPFMYISKSSSATDTSDKLKIKGKEVLTVGSEMKVEQPGNVTCRPTGGDVVSHMVNATSGTFSGSDKVKAGGRKVCCTGDGVYMNVPADGKIAQIQTRLIEGATLRRWGAAAGRFAGRFVGMLDPVSASTGEVFDEDLDLAVSGLVRLEFKRLYNSGKKELTPLGIGGWTHNLHQWVASVADGYELRDGDGRDLLFRGVEDGRGYHRGRHLRLAVHARRFEVFSLEDRLTRVFEPLDQGAKRAMLTRIVDGWGNAIALSYDQGRLTRASGPSGRDLVFTYDRRGLLQRVEIWSLGAARQAVEYRYNDDGELSAVRDALGNEDTYAYDGMHRMVHKALPTGFSVYYAYDAESGRCVRTWGDGMLLSGNIEYDDDLGATALTGTPLSQIFHWNEQGSVTAIEASDGSYHRKLERDDDQLLTRYENALGQSWHYLRAESGLLERYVDADGRATEIEYRDGLVVAQTDPGGYRSSYDYDEHDALVRVRYPSGAVVTLVYDRRGRIERVDGPSGTDVSFEFDEEDNAVVERDALGRATR